MRLKQVAMQLAIQLQSSNAEAPVLDAMQLNLHVLEAVANRLEEARTVLQYLEREVVSQSRWAKKLAEEKTLLVMVGNEWLIPLSTITLAYCTL